MAKFIEIKTFSGDKITLNIDHIISIYGADSETYIQLANPSQSGRFSLNIDQHYDEFVKWFNKQISSSTQNWSDEYGRIEGGK